MEAITLKSGATIELHPASFADGTKLYKVIFNELLQVDIDLSNLAGKDINSLKNGIFRLMGSDALESVIFQCAAKSLRDGQKITKSTFEPAEARRDWWPVAWEVIKFNVAPFVEDIDLSFLTSVKPSPSAQQ